VSGVPPGLTFTPAPGMGSPSSLSTTLPLRVAVWAPAMVVARRPEPARATQRLSAEPWADTRMGSHHVRASGAGAPQVDCVKCLESADSSLIRNNLETQATLYSSGARLWDRHGLVEFRVETTRRRAPERMRNSCEARYRSGDLGGVFPAKCGQH
jgi:hypothetical protein